MNRKKKEMRLTVYADSTEKIANSLHTIADMLREGYTSGINCAGVNAWDLEEAKE